jgi:hypothetical protein
MHLPFLRSLRFLLSNLHLHFLCCLGVLLFNLPFVFHMSRFSRCYIHETAGAVFFGQKTCCNNLQGMSLAGIRVPELSLNSLPPNDASIP